MVKTLFIRPYAGNLPEWMEEYNKNIEGLHKYGFDWLVVNTDILSKLIKEKLKLTPDFSKDLCKSSEFGPALGVIFEDYLKGYDFWGYTNLDMVYGRLDRFMTESFLKQLDIYGNDPRSMCGPFSILRNIPDVNNLFKQYPNWREMFEDPIHHEFDERGFSDIVNHETRLRVKFGFMQANDKLGHEVELKSDGTLLVDGKEEMMYHFKESKRWPL